MTSATHRVLGLLLLASCGENRSLGDYDSSSGGSGSGGDTSTGGSASATSTTGSTGQTSAETGVTTAEGSGTDGPASCGPGNCELFPPPCGDACGDLDSPFDDQGCLRTPCANDDNCGDGEVCYVGMQFGLCVSSGIACADSVENQSCDCGGDPDCSGGFCVPTDLFPALEPAPGTIVRVQGTCGPDDGPAVLVSVYPAEATVACGTANLQPELEVLFVDVGPDTTIEQTSASPMGEVVVGGESRDVFHARLALDSLDLEQMLCSGSLEVSAVDGGGGLHRYGTTFVDALACPMPSCP
ncbi:MAG: hypothetical protein K1X88_00650 [Nannocystaceae bacterium]|nr:hypothetical protein [Nannocystaceae bacterium]